MGSALNKAQRTSLSAMLAYTAHKKNVSEEIVQHMVASHFGVENLTKLSSQSYDSAIKYIADLRFDLILH